MKNIAIKFILLLAVFSGLFAHNNLINTGQSGCFIEVGYDNSKHARFLNEISTGYIFKNGLSVKTSFAYENYWFMAFIGPSYQIWNLEQGIEVAYPFLKQKERSMPINLIFNVAYDFNYGTHHPYTHSVRFGLNLSRRVRLLKDFELIPSLSAMIMNNTELYLDDENHNYSLPVFSGQAILKYKFIYVYADLMYESAYIIDSISHNRQLSTHFGLGFIIPNKK